MDETVERRPEHHLDETRDGPARPRLREDLGLGEGRFEVRGTLGRGGMGDVLRAYDRTTGREVAIKVLRADRLTTAQQERFRREGEITASLDHPGIVRAHSAGISEREQPYIVYELVEGRTLGEVLPQVDGTERLRLLRDVAEALGHAHRAGVVHRDVKPSNVLVDERGAVRVADFGLAAGRHLQRLTQTGTLLGTVAYMSPEMVRGERVGPAADVWGLGVILYEALTGELPFKGTFAEISEAIQRADPDPPRRLVPEVSAGLSELCLRCLSANPDRRPADGAALAAELDASLAGERRRASGLVPLLGVCAFGVILSATLLALPSAPAPPGDAPTPTPSRDPGSAPVGPPGWYGSLPGDERPSLPLPAGLEFGERPGEYLHPASGGVLVYVPAGRYHLGDESPQTLANPVREVELSGYFVGKCEVTVAQFARYLRATGRDPQQVTGKPRWPAQPIVLREAEEFCAWAGLRLPSEAEWEVAARGPAANTWPWGDDPGAPERQGNFNRGRGGDLPSPVGSFPDGASPFGCLDMAGNVDEWVGELIEDLPREAERVGRGEVHVIRGGRSSSDTFACRTFFRRAHSTTARRALVGFRVALSSTSLPAWWGLVPPDRRPAMPLPKGMSFGDARGEYVNDADGSVLVYVPGGRFAIGYDQGMPDDGPAHEVQLAPYFIGKHEVTGRKFLAFLSRTGTPDMHLASESLQSEKPVSMVDYDQASAYCAWAGLRLPTETEWEAAARGTDGRLWPWGNDPPRLGGQRANLSGGPVKVGSYPRGASPYGALDMAGNVSEWVSGQPSAYGDRPDLVVLPADSTRLVRGGSYGSRSTRSRSYRRRILSRDSRRPELGFRVARSVGEEGTLPAWFAALPPSQRPPDGVPEGVVVGARQGEYVNTKDGSVLVYVPPGRFRMGSDRGTPLESPEHWAERATGFFIGRYELTRGAWARFCEDTQRPSVVPREPPNHPVDRVSWHEAQAYCRWAGLRLPQELEWEYAARGTDGRTWPWGEVPPGQGRLANVGLFRDATAVGAFPAGVSPFGCHDMTGNVAEWVEDPPAIYRLGQRDVLFPSEATHRVYRGGTWHEREFRIYCRTFSRRAARPELGRHGVGFRVARDQR